MWAYPVLIVILVLPQGEKQHNIMAKSMRGYFLVNYWVGVTLGVSLALCGCGLIDLPTLGFSKLSSCVCTGADRSRQITGIG